MMNEKKLERSAKFVLFIASLITCFVILTYWYHFRMLSISNVPADWGPFGDFFGGVINPILSFSSLILVLISIRQQSVSIEQSSEQIKVSIEEVKKSVAAQEEQVSLAEKQFISLSKRNQVDDYRLILNEAFKDIQEQLDIEIICFKRASSKRSFRSQLLDVIIISKKAMNEKDKVIMDFMKTHEERYNIYRKSIDYYNEAIARLERCEELNNKVISDYYKVKLDILGDVIYDIGN
ncbi:hypothetical protein [Aeromonas veronii]|uniref:hypothetical protein n=1 Tax=Aeromonas veronii TaxID=654 RepID=UPI00111649B4|nr:hypothetical protein [Aeromonas veronii]TNI98258.1 hypothetical protein CF114_10190 [Aeromonas veronii]